MGAKIGDTKCQHLCAYCKKEYSIDRASKSDIIPFAFIAGKKLTLSHRVCVDCNNLVNRIAEQSVITQFESLRRRINARKRRGDSLCNRYVLRYVNDTTMMETNPIGCDNPRTILEKPLYFRVKNGKGALIGPYKKVVEVASRKGGAERVAELKIDNENLTIFQTYSISLKSFFSQEMKTMVAKICFEWIISICPDLDPLEADYDHIRNAIYLNLVEQNHLVDVITDINIAKGLFEDISHLKGNGITELVPQKLLVGDYYLFFEIGEQKLYCYFAFMGLILYRVLITTEILPDTGNGFMISSVYKYKGRTGELEVMKVNQDTWPVMSRHLNNPGNHNNVEGYRQFLSDKIQELVQFKVEE